jgi:hypothetical protein
MSVQRTIDFEEVRHGKSRLEDAINGLILTDVAAIQATAEDNEVLIGEATSFSSWMIPRLRYPPRWRRMTSKPA